jgi:hypothetical protein
MDNVPHYDYSAAGVIIDGIFGDEVEANNVKLTHHINKHVEDKVTIDRLTAELDTMTLANRSLEARVASLESYAPSVPPGKRLRSSSHDEAGPSNGESDRSVQEITDFLNRFHAADSTLPELLDVDTLPYEAPAPDIPQQAFVAEVLHQAPTPEVPYQVPTPDIPQQAFVAEIPYQPPAAEILQQAPQLLFLADATLDEHRRVAMGPGHNIRFRQLTKIKGRGSNSEENALRWAFKSCIKDSFRNIVPFKGSVENMQNLEHLADCIRTAYTKYWTSLNVPMCSQLDGVRDSWNVYGDLRQVIAYDVMAILLRDLGGMGL